MRLQELPNDFLFTLHYTIHNVYGHSALWRLRSERKGVQKHPDTQSNDIADTDQ